MKITIRIWEPFFVWRRQFLFISRIFLYSLNGTPARDFHPLVFFMKRTRLVPWFRSWILFSRHTFCAHRVLIFSKCDITQILFEFSYSWYDMPRGNNHDSSQLFSCANRPISHIFVPPTYHPLYSPYARIFPPYCVYCIFWFMNSNLEMHSFKRPKLSKNIT